MFKIDIPDGAGYIINELNKNGYEAYIVGGCVRDALLGRIPSDWDITTSATPGDIKRIFRRTVDTGIEHGTVTVLTYEYAPITSYEVTTYRIDGAYSDHRRPDSVSFTTSLEEDLKRRDFTINAMAYNDERGLVDLYGGCSDLKNGIIKCVGNASERFDEDALRILRAVRFAAQLSFDIEEETRQAMKRQSVFLKDISAERIQMELTKLITSKHPEKLITAYELGITSIILPEFDAMMETEQNNPYHIYNVGMHTIEVMKHIPQTPVLRYTALLHDVGKPNKKQIGKDGYDHFYGHQEESQEMARRILRRLKLDNHTIDKTCLLIKYHDFGISEDISTKSIRRFVSKLGAENFEDFMYIRRADMAGQSGYRLEERKQTVEKIRDTFRTIMEEEQCIRLADLKLNGSDLIHMGMTPGKELGETLKYLFELVLDYPELNEKAKLTELVHEYRKKTI
ncbi:MAG: CCA tRNA nucleotidyltransferase [Clostridium sp.]|nr:CCA tRNA nucleotidyltransferase [Clostridium sp.]MCM1399087.1 CCA tRNA nucleotidyltransferase [Clostridium sp.]MCM1459479.1 CCA tRNA nucleotidyltransferase [Bacteroides sp.]